MRETPPKNYKDLIMEISMKSQKDNKQNLIKGLLEMGVNLVKNKY